MPAGLSDVKAIAAGNSHVLALRSNGTVIVWGTNTRILTQTGEIDLTPTNVPPGLSNVTAIAAGSFHNVILKADGSVFAWGAPWATNYSPGLSNVVKIAAGDTNSMALQSDGKLVVWGGNALLAEVPPDLGPVMAMGCDSVAAVAVRRDGSVVAWGAGADTNGLTSARYWANRGLTNVPPNVSDVVDVSVGNESAFARKRDGTFVGWGWNSGYQASVPPFHSDVVSLGTPQCFINGTGKLVHSGFLPPYDTPPADLNNVVMLAKGVSANTLALRSDGTVVAWGLNSSGQTNVPAGLSNVIAVAEGDYHCVALRADGRVIAWGQNLYGLTNVPAGLNDVKAISANTTFTLALRSNGTMTAWGNNFHGQINVPHLNDVVAISAGSSHGLAVRSNGRVTAWGGNLGGQTNVPPGLSNVVAVSGGYAHSLAPKSDGKVVAWGGAGFSLAGNTPPPGLKNVIRIMAFGSGDYALVLDPTLSIVRQANSSILLGFRSFFGQRYQIQYSPDLAPNGWFNLPGGNVTGTGADVEVIDNSILPGQAARFYRLVELD